MFSIVHLSDLHFGRIHPDILAHLEDFLRLRKDEITLTVLTGDLTQRARGHEFVAARDFLGSLAAPLFLVPGNHDVPLYNLLLRFFSPYKKFLKYVGPFARNYYEDDHVAVFGLWTVDNFAVQTGKFRPGDLDELEERFRRVPAQKLRIVAAHHPLVAIRHPRIDEDLRRVIAAGPHLLLWGHEHQSGVDPLLPGRTFPLALSSGTSASTRTRAEANSFNYVCVTAEGLTVEIYRHSKILGAFEAIDRRVVRREEGPGPLLRT